MSACGRMRRRRAATHQADEDEDELYDVRVRDGVQAPHQRVGDGHGGRNPDAHGVGEIQDHAHGYTCGWVKHCKRPSPCVLNTAKSSRLSNNLG